VDATRIDRNLGGTGTPRPRFCHLRPVRSDAPPTDGSNEGGAKCVRLRVLASGLHRNSSTRVPFARPQLASASSAGFFISRPPKYRDPVMRGLPRHRRFGRAGLVVLVTGLVLGSALSVAGSAFRVIPAGPLQTPSLLDGRTQSLCPILATTPPRSTNFHKATTVGYVSVGDRFVYTFTSEPNETGVALLVVGSVLRSRAAGEKVWLGMGERPH